MKIEKILSRELGNRLSFLKQEDIKRVSNTLVTNFYLLNFTPEVFQGTVSVDIVCNISTKAVAEHSLPVVLLYFIFFT